MRWHDGWGPGAWIAMAFVMVVFWSLVVTAIVLAVRGTTRAETRQEPEPERILAERFARGEIDADEYMRRRELLRSR